MTRVARLIEKCDTRGAVDKEFLRAWDFKKKKNFVYLHKKDQKKTIKFLQILQIEKKWKVFVDIPLPVW